MPADGTTDLQTLGRLQSDAPSAGIRYAKELLFLVASDYATESRRKGIKQHAGDNHKGPSLCNKARPARKECVAPIVPKPPWKAISPNPITINRSVAPMTVPAILCDALPCSKPKKSRHIPTVFPNSGSALRTSAITVATMSCPQKPVGLVRSKPDAPSMMGRNAQSNSGLKKPLRIPITRLTGNFIAISLSKSLIERGPPAYVGGPDKT